MEVVLVSACLVGLQTRYDTSHRKDDVLLALLAGKVVVPVCPEQLGGLPTPRPKSEFSGGDGFAVLEGKAVLRNERGLEVTENFVRGARAVLEIARLTGARCAYFKERSPSCGTCLVRIDGQLVEGSGVTTALLLRAGIEVVPR